MSEEDEKYSSMKLSDFADIDVQHLIKNVKNHKCYQNELNKNLKEELFDPMKEQIDKLLEEKAFKAVKHYIQQAALLEALKKHELLKEKYCYIELGAGKGGLTEKIAEIYKNAKFVIVDRAPVKQKKEKQFQNAGQDNFERVKIDIADLALEELKDEDEKICIAKHLCGEATDLAIRGSIRATNISGILIAM